MCQTLDAKLYSVFQYLYVDKYVDQKGSAAMPAVKKSAGVAPEVNLRNPLHAGDEACKQEMHPGFETQGRLHQKSKSGVPVALTKKNWKTLSWKSDPVIPIYILPLSSIALILPWP